MSTVYLGLGTNMGERDANLRRAIDGLANEVLITAFSPVYETDAWGIEDQPNFLNMCVIGETKLTPLRLLQYIKDLESQLGRVPTKRWGPRLIDIDILFIDDLILNEPGLSVPHKGIADRATVLVPLADIAPKLFHPVLMLRIVDMLAEVDRSGVRLFRLA